jgi:acyl-ACP thioesterase
MLERPDRGRVFQAGRRVRLAVVDPRGRCRLDATVRHLQDVARDDSADGGLPEALTWVVRRTLLHVHRSARFEEWLDLATWCSGYGSRWAERRTDVQGEHGAHIEAVTVWVFVDAESGRPSRLPDGFHSLWGETAGDRRVSARTSLQTTWPADASEEPWSVRYSDLDVLSHVNNAAHWSAVEEAIDHVGMKRGRLRAELEHGVGVDRGADVRLRWIAVDGGVDTWLTADGASGSVASVRPLDV